MTYFFAHLLFPLQHIGNGMLAREIDVTVEDDTFAEDRRDVHCILGCVRAKKKRVKHYYVMMTRREQ